MNLFSLPRETNIKPGIRNTAQRLLCVLELIGPSNCVQGEIDYVVMDYSCSKSYCFVLKKKIQISHTNIIFLNFAFVCRLRAVFCFTRFHHQLDNKLRISIQRRAPICNTQRKNIQGLRILSN